MRITSTGRMNGRETWQTFGQVFLFVCLLLLAVSLKIFDFFVEHGFGELVEAGDVAQGVAKV